MSSHRLIHKTRRLKWKREIKFVSLLLPFTFAVAFLGGSQSISKTQNAAVAQGAETRDGVNRAYIDATCAPCKDFFLYANGVWLKSVTIPPTQNTWGPQQEATARNESVLHDILESLASAPDRAWKGLGVRPAILRFFRASPLPTKGFVGRKGLGVRPAILRFFRASPLPTKGFVAHLEVFCRGESERVLARLVPEIESTDYADYTETEKH